MPIKTLPAAIASHGQAGHARIRLERNACRRFDTLKSYAVALIFLDTTGDFFYGLLYSADEKYALTFIYNINDRCKRGVI